MSNNHNVLSCGATLFQAVAAYIDLHPIDDDDDPRNEQCSHVFDPEEETNINFLQRAW